MSDTHPDASLPWADGDVAVYAYLIEHPAGLMLVDTGVGQGNNLIDTVYRPEHHDVDDVIAGAGYRIDDVEVIINSHLHFDHCGQNRRFPGVPILVQRREYEAAQRPGYTVPEWVDFPGAEIQLLDGDLQVADGVRLVSTPGHTPGHQSVLIDDDEERVVVCAQAAYTASDFSVCRTDPHGSEDDATQRAAIQRLHALRPHRVCFSHDTTDWLDPAP